MLQHGQCPIGVTHSSLNPLELGHYATGYSLKKSIPKQQTKTAQLNYMLLKIGGDCGKAEC